MIDANTALIVSTMITTSGGIITVLITVLVRQNRIHNEVTSPNGKSTGDAIAEIREDVHEIKDDLHDVKQEQRRVKEELRALRESPRWE